MSIIFKTPNKNKKKRVLSILTIAAALIVLGVVLIIFGARDVNSPLNGAVNSVQGFLANISTGVGNFFKGVFSADDVVEKNAELESKLAEMELLRTYIQDLENENDRLEELLGYVEKNSDITCLAAKVIARNPDHWYSVLTVNRGTRHGVYKDMCVLTQDGLVGVVSAVGNNWAEIVTIADSRCSVPALIERNNNNGIICGVSDSSIYTGKCELSKLPYEVDILPGDEIVTSGVGGVYPKGLNIGKVLEVSKVQNGLQKTAIVVPAVELEKLNYVLIVKNFNAPEQKSEEPVLDVIGEE